MYKLGQRFDLVVVHGGIIQHNERCHMAVSRTGNSIEPRLAVAAYRILADMQQFFDTPQRGAPVPVRACGTRADGNFLQTWAFGGCLHRGF